MCSKSSPTMELQLVFVDLFFPIFLKPREISGEWCEVGIEIRSAVRNELSSGVGGRGETVLDIV